MALFLGIDGGGSKTSCLVGNETSVLGSGTAGASNIVRVGEVRARESLHAAVRQACGLAKITPSQIQGICVGIAGAGRPEVRDLVHCIVAELVSNEIEVVGDMEIALAAAFGSEPGVIVIAGTGSIAYGRNSAGQTERAGGLGFAISDEGSGHWIGRTAVSAALRDGDSGISSLLLEAIKKAWGGTDREQVILAANASPSPDFAALLPVVLAAAKDGDRTAHAVLTRAGIELAILAKAVIQRLFPGINPVPVAMSGGVFSNSAVVREVFYNSLRSEFPGTALNQAVVEPVFGALELARKGARR